MNQRTKRWVALILLFSITIEPHSVIVRISVVTYLFYLFMYSGESYESEN